LRFHLSPPAAAATNNMYTARGLREQTDFTSREKTGVDKAAAVIEVRWSAVVDCGEFIGLWISYFDVCVMCTYDSPTSRRARNGREWPGRTFVPIAYIYVWVCLCVCVCVLCAVWRRACVRAFYGLRWHETKRYDFTISGLMDTHTPSTGTDRFIIPPPANPLAHVYRVSTPYFKRTRHNTWLQYS